MDFSRIGLLLMMTCFYSLIQFNGKVVCQVHYDPLTVGTTFAEKRAKASPRSGYFFSKKTTNTSRTLDQCGFRNFFKPKEGDFPWAATVLFSGLPQLIFGCNANLISNRHILTVARCLKTTGKEVNTSTLVIVIGNYDIQHPDDAHRYAVKTTNIHSTADIAVLTLTEEVEFKTFVRPICLWTGNVDVKELDGVVGTVTGWQTITTESMWMLEPKEFNLSVVIEGECYRYLYHSKNKTLRFFCAEPDWINDTAPCDRTFGSGFMMKQKNRWTLIGVVSWWSYSKIGVCEYVVFSDISFWSNWILNIINI